MKELLHFTAEWCGPCKKIKPIIEEYISNHQDIKYQQINVDDFGQIALDHNVLSIPTLISKIDGQIVNRHTGVATKEQIAALFNNPNTEMVE